MDASLNIRDAKPSDEMEWRRLWDGYIVFYETAVAPEITARTWQRILDPSSPMIGRIAEYLGKIVGFSVSVLHDGTWVPNPVCHLEDLFVDPTFRGKGAGRRLIQDLINLAKERNWSSLYWQTRAGNPARRLYDEFVGADDFVRYRLQF
jgi:GNAT superfamily N-acetyltransferase